MKEYECIKPFSITYYDIETDSYDETKFYDIKVGSIWEQEEDYLSGSYTGAEIHLDGDDGWIEISEENLKEYFKKL